MRYIITRQLFAIFYFSKMRSRKIVDMGLCMWWMQDLDLEFLVVLQVPLAS